jgi:hypothetical protein
VKERLVEKVERLAKVVAGMKGTTSGEGAEKEGVP